jgi:hypothetical protein
LALDTDITLYAHRSPTTWASRHGALFSAVSLSYDITKSADDTLRADTVFARLSLMCYWVFITLRTEVALFPQTLLTKASSRNATNLVAVAAWHFVAAVFAAAKFLGDKLKATLYTPVEVGVRLSHFVALEVLLAFLSCTVHC